MSSNIVDLCEAVKDALNAEVFSQSFTAVFEFNPNFSNMDAKTLRVVVTDAGGDIGLVSRAMVGYTDSVRVVVLHRVDAGSTGVDTTKIKADLLLLEELATFLISRGMAGYSPQGTITRGTGDKDKQHYMAGNLDERLFAASLVISYETKVSLRESSS